MRKISKKHRNKPRKRKQRTKAATPPKQTGGFFSSKFNCCAGGLGIAVAVTAAAFSLGSTSDLINAESDARIRTACPQISNVQTATIRSDWNSYTALINGTSIGGLKHLTQMSETTIDIVGHKLVEILKADKYEQFYMDVDSLGGSVLTALLYTKAMKESSARIITSSDTIAASGGSVILFAGTPGYRYASSSTTIVVHTARVGQDKIRFIEDFKPEQAEYRGLKKANGWLRDQYEELSVTGITKPCVKALIRGKDDMLISPNIALKLGWIDAVKNVNWWTGKYDGTITVRADDPRAQPKVPAQTIQARLN